MNIDNITSESMTLNNDGKSMQIKVYEELIDKLQSNWNSLRELIEQYLENEKYSYMSDNPKDRCRYDIFMEIKDKMNELEGKDNERI